RGSGASQRRSGATSTTPTAARPARSRIPAGVAVRGVARRRVEAMARVARRRSVLAVGGASPAGGAGSASRPLCARGGVAMASRRSVQTSRATTQSAMAEGAYVASKRAGGAARGPRSVLSSITSGRSPRPTTPRLLTEPGSKGPILLIMTRAAVHRIPGVAAIAGVVVLSCMALSGRASAEVGAPAGTVEATAANMLFDEYAPPPPTPGIICLVDSGVNPNPDTTSILAGSHALSANTNTEDELAGLNPPLPGRP